MGGFSKHGVVFTKIYFGLNDDGAMAMQESSAVFPIEEISSS